MNTHEYQAKEILRKYGIPIPAFGVVASEAEAEALLKQLKLKQAVVKAQVHAGGRGKAGGVKFAKTPAEVLALVKEMLGKRLVTHQTGSEGVIIHQVLLSDPVDIEKEYYLGCVIDRDRALPTLIASPEGGVEIEEVAAKTPERILTLPIGFDGKMRQFHLVQLVKFMGWKGEQAKQGIRLTKALAQAFTDTDASLLEINPLVKTPQGELLALDAKLSIDDSAVYRQPEIAKFYDPSQQVPAEVEANKHGLAYIALTGNIGCLVNGAGLAMATMDLIKHHGGEPANFLDVGGGASKETVTEAFKIILTDPQLRAILVNIFGGIMNCGTIAEGIIAACDELDLKVPLVVRMEGTHVERGRKLLKESGLNIISADHLSGAAEKVVEAARG